MEITNKPQNIQFTSKMNPVRAFNIKTDLGNVRIYEPKTVELFSNEFLENVIDMLCRNFTKDTKDPGWLRYQNPKYKKEFELLKKSYLEETKSQIMYDDGHLTFLVAKNGEGKICGACISYGLQGVPTAETTAMYVDSIAVEKEYRGFGIAKKMLERAIKADSKHFTDAFLAGENLAEGFYKKLGFSHLNPRNENQNTVINWMKYDRFDYPKYVSFLTKPLQKSKQRWYDKAASVIKSQYSWNG